MNENENKTTILIVEDDRALRSIVSERLQKDGYEVLESENGEVGVTMAKQFHPDLILLDIVMPKMSGIEVLTDLRKDDWGHSARVIMLTNMSTEEQKKQVSALGVKDYLVKSNWDIEGIVERISENLGTPKN